MSHGTVKKKKDSTYDDNDVAIAPLDGGWGWMVVFGSFMIHIIADGFTYTFGFFYVQFLEYFGESNAATSWIHSILVGVTLGTGPISSSFVNKYGCRSVTIAGALLASASLVVSVFAPSVTFLYITIGLGTGLGFGLIYLPAIVSVTCYFEKYRAFATGIAVCGSGLGTFLFSPLTETLIEEYRWQGAMLIIAGIVLNCVLFGALFRPLEPTPIQLIIRNGDTDDLPAADDEEESLCIANPQTNGKAMNGDIRKNNSDCDLQRRENGIQRNLSTGTFPPPPRRTSATPTKSDGKYSEIARMALSQPALGLPETPNNVARSQLLFGSQGLNRSERRPSLLQSSAGLMYRKDIFYHGSLQNIPQYRSNPRLYTDLVLKKPDEDAEPLEDEGNGYVCGCIPCSSESRDTLKEMLDLSLFRDPIFILFTVSNFCTSIGFNVPYLYIVPKAEETVENANPTILLSTIGIANTVGRVVLGFLADNPHVNRLYLYNTCLTICGIATIFSALCYNMLTMVIYAAVFGFTIGAYVGLTSVVLVDLLGLDKLTNAFGLLLLFQGVASFIGPPIAGGLRDSMNSYDPGFYLAGFMIAISGLMLFAIPCLQWKQQQKEMRDRPQRV